MRVRVRVLEEVGRVRESVRAAADEALERLAGRVRAVVKPHVLLLRTHPPAISTEVAGSGRRGRGRGGEEAVGEV